VETAKISDLGHLKASRFRSVHFRGDPIFAISVKSMKKPPTYHVVFGTEINYIGSIEKA
jgi:hypothetical protein